MLPKKFKICNKLRIGHALKKGFRVSSRFFSFRYLVNNSGPPRFALIISKKVSPKAVLRNKLRRRVYAAIEDFLKGSLPLPTEKCYDIAVLCSPRAKDLPYADIKKDLFNCLKKLS